jgi:hypothetical protein
VRRRDKAARPLNDLMTTRATRQAQYDAVCDWSVPNHAALQRVSAIGQPVFIANGDRL